MLFITHCKCSVKMSDHSEHSVNDSAYFIFIIAAESLMWFWSVVNIKHHIARVVFASASSYQRCLGGKSAKTLSWKVI